VVAHLSVTHLSVTHLSVTHLSVTHLQKITIPFREMAQPQSPRGYWFL